MRVRWMIDRDIPEVLQISRTCYEDPWSEDDFKIVRKKNSCISFVVEDEKLGGKIIGYMIYEMYRHKFHILNFGVHQRHRRQKVGTLMIDRLKEKLDEKLRYVIELDSAEDCLSAHEFLKSQYFRAVRVNREQFEDTNGFVDGYTFRYSLPLDDLLPESTETMEV